MIILLYHEDVAKSRLKTSNPQHLSAAGLKSGLSPIVPGTMGSLAAIPFWYLMTSSPWQLYSLVVMLGIRTDVYLYHQVVKDMGTYDHGSIIWDESIGMWVVLMMLPTSDWQWVTAGFVASRILDMWKSRPIRWFDRNVHGGMGIMIDDIVARVISVGTLYFIGYHWPLGIPSQLYIDARCDACHVSSGLHIYSNLTTGCSLYGVFSSAICSGFKAISIVFSSSSSYSSREVPIIGAAVPGLLNDQASATYVCIAPSSSLTPVKRSAIRVLSSLLS